MILLFVSLLSVVSPSANGEEAAKPSATPLYGVPGKCLLQSDFSNSKLEEAWQVEKGKWEVSDGTLVGTQIPEQNHAAVLRHQLALHDFVAEFTFKFNGGKAIKLVLNKNTVHIATVAIWPGVLTIDKQPERDSGKKIRRIDAQNVKLNADDWHTAVVEVVGDTIVASIDGSHIVFGSDDGLDIDKTDFDFAANGSAAIRTLKICQATAPADTQTARQKLQALRDAKP